MGCNTLVDNLSSIGEDLGCWSLISLLCLHCVGVGCRGRSLLLPNRVLLSLSLSLSLSFIDFYNKIGTGVTCSTLPLMKCPHVQELIKEGVTMCSIVQKEEEWGSPLSLSLRGVGCWCLRNGDWIQWLILYFPISVI